MSEAVQDVMLQLRRLTEAVQRLTQENAELRRRLRTCNKSKILQTCTIASSGPRLQLQGSPPDDGRVAAAAAAAAEPGLRGDVIHDVIISRRSPPGLEEAEIHPVRDLRDEDKV